MLKSPSSRLRPAVAGGGVEQVPDDQHLSKMGGGANVRIHFPSGWAQKPAELFVQPRKRFSGTLQVQGKKGRVLRILRP